MKRYSFTFSYFILFIWERARQCVCGGGQGQLLLYYNKVYELIMHLKINNGFGEIIKECHFIRQNNCATSVLYVDNGYGCVITENKVYMVTNGFSTKFCCKG